ncbi:MAG: FAD-binding oxidoreductase [Archangium sp.]|nr:FAD-binding oxidoreductase [Archangium sp.]
MATRNVWGWGVTEAAVSLEETQGRIEPFFGASEIENASAMQLPKPRLEVPAALREFATAADLDRASHSMGKSYPDRVRGFRGDFSVAPDFVAYPRNERELSAVLEVAEKEKLSVTPFGGGSSVVAGVEPKLGPGHRGALTLDLSKLSRVIEVDDVSHLARIEGGIFGPALEQALAPRGFTLRHFPQSFEFSTLGGWIATRAGGHFATVLTHIDELVHSVRMISPRGVFETRSFPASGAGSDPNRLVVGSEGTLGVITEAWMRIRPKPTFRAGASMHFEDFHEAVEATRAVAQSGLSPSNCRLLDSQEAMINGVTFDGNSVLVLAFESADHPLDAWIDRAMAICAELGGTCPRGKTSGQKPGDAGEAWRASFLKGPYLQDAMIRLGVIADTFETACTWKRFPELYASVKSDMEAALTRLCGSGIVSCRFTHVYPDGPAPYFTFLGRSPKRGAELETWNELKRVAGDALARAGGTITHHHAVGRTHRPWYDRERPEPFARVWNAAKRELDPLGLLNPGVLFDAAH